MNTFEDYDEQIWETPVNVEELCDELGNEEVQEFYDEFVTGSFENLVDDVLDGVEEIRDQCIGIMHSYGSTMSFRSFYHEIVPWLVVRFEHNEDILHYFLDELYGSVAEDFAATLEDIDKELHEWLAGFAVEEFENIEAMYGDDQETAEFDDPLLPEDYLKKYIRKELVHKENSRN